MSWECDNHAYGPGTDRCGLEDPRLRGLAKRFVETYDGDQVRATSSGIGRVDEDLLFQWFRHARDDRAEEMRMTYRWPDDEPFDQGARQGYRDQLAGRVTRDAFGGFASVPDEWRGDAEYIEGYAEGVDQAETDQRGGRA